MTSRGSRTVDRVPLSPRGQRLVHGDGVCLHLTLQAVHLLPGDEGGKGGNAGQRGARKEHLPWQPSPHISVTPSGTSSTDGVAELKGPNTPLLHAEATGLRGCPTQASALGDVGRPPRACHTRPLNTWGVRPRAHSARDNAHFPTGTEGPCLTETHSAFAGHALLAIERRLQVKHVLWRQATWGQNVL